MKLEVISSHPKHLKHTTPLLFVHGAWHGAWCWENFLPYFADHGYEAHALSLRGHGASEGREGIRWYSGARDYVADVAQVVNGLGKKPVLIGHSMGGYVVQKYLETRNVPASVLLASVPVMGTTGMIMRSTKRYPKVALKTLLLFDAGYLVSAPAVVRDALFSDGFPEVEFSKHYARVQTESFRVTFETTLLHLPQPQKVKTPMLVLAAENDRVFTVAEQKATARAYGTEAVIFPNMAHDMMLEKDWRQVADKIMGWLETRH
jgi:pimeloyl-ACP methyl ester carboxylesterase